MNKKTITHQLQAQFGIPPELFKNTLFIEAGKGKIRLFTGNPDILSQLQELTKIQAVGLYALRQEKDNSLRLTLDATHLLKSEITKNTIQLTKEETKEWLQGHDLEKETSRGIKVVLHNSDALGCARSNGERLNNHIPKERRTRN